MAESSLDSVVCSSDEIILSSDDDEDVRRNDGNRSPDMFLHSANSSICSRSPPTGVSTDENKATKLFAAGDAVVISDDDDPWPQTTPWRDRSVVVVSDSDHGSEGDVDSDEPEKKLIPSVEPQPPEERPKLRTRKGKKTAIILKDLEEALSEIARDDAKSKNKERLSFLSSLSEKTFGLPVHPQAHFYKTNFKYLKEKLAEMLFETFNAHVFGRGLATDTKLEWSGRLTSTAGKTILVRRRTGTFESSILLSTKILTTAEKLRDTLIHEMCHAAAFTIDRVVNANHGPVWEKWTKLATKRFPELPPIGVTHSYSIQYKYNWECQLCGHKVGRHKNTIDLNRHVCPYCHGRFQRIQQ